MATAIAPEPGLQRVDPVDRIVRVRRIDPFGVLGGLRGLAAVRVLAVVAEGLGVPARYAVSTWLAASSPSSAIDVSRILNFCTLPVTVIGKPSVTRTYRGTL